MTSPAHRVYSIDNVFRVLVQHSSKPLLVKIMMLEQKGTIFNACVEELYREVDYHAIQDMTRDTPRKSQYLNAVVHVKADAPFEFMSNHMSPRQLSEMKFGAKPCSPEAAIALRDQCPNVKTIARLENGRSGQIVTITFEDGKDTGLVHVHDRIDLVPSSSTRQFQLPTISTFSTYFWRRWNIEYTVGMIVLKASQSQGGADEAMKAYFLDTDQLDPRITEVQTGWLLFTLSELNAIASSRYPSKQPLTRISSTIKAFSIEQFTQFIMTAGKELCQLHLHTQPHPSKITPLDLPAIVRLVRTQCPKLVDLRLPMSFAMGDIDLIDDAIALPPCQLARGPGTVQKLTILGYNLGKRQYTDLEEICSWNFARNLACLLAPDFELYLCDGSTATSQYSFVDQTGMPTPSWIAFGKLLKEAVSFFQRLGPVLEPHLTHRGSTPMGMPSFDFLGDLEYKPNGTPIWLGLDNAWSNAKMAKWHDAQRNSYYDDEEEEEEDMYEAFDHDDESDHDADEMYLERLAQEAQDDADADYEYLEQEMQDEMEYWLYHDDYDGEQEQEEFEAAYGCFEQVPKDELQAWNDGVDSDRPQKQEEVESLPAGTEPEKKHSLDVGDAYSDHSEENAEVGQSARHVHLDQLQENQAEEDHPGHDDDESDDLEEDMRRVREDPVLLRQYWEDIKQLEIEQFEYEHGYLPRPLPDPERRYAAIYQARLDLDKAAIEEIPKKRPHPPSSFTDTPGPSQASSQYDQAYDDNAKKPRL